MYGKKLTVVCVNIEMIRNEHDGANEEKIYFARCAYKFLVFADFSLWVYLH
jgi:hypothetical protein